MNNTKTLSQRMKSRREQLNISAQEIAEQTGLSKATIHRYENGDIKNIKLPVIESLAIILNVSPDWLIGKTDRMNREQSDYIELSNPSDVHDIIKNVTSYIANREDLHYKNKILSDELKLILLNHLKSTISIIDELSK